MSLPSRNCTHTLDLFTQHVSRGNRILDVSCGSGGFAYHLEKLGFDSVHSIDINDYRQYEVEKFQIYDGVNIPCSNKEFDVVALNMVLHHVSNEKKVPLLREVKRVTRGQIFVLEDTPRNPLDWVVSNMHGEYFRRRISSKEGYGFYTQSKWEQVFVDLGLEIIISEKLSRFCRRKTRPFARSFFFLACQASR